VSTLVGYGIWAKLSLSMMLVQIDPGLIKPVVEVDSARTPINKSQVQQLTECKKTSDLCGLDMPDQVEVQSCISSPSGQVANMPPMLKHQRSRFRLHGLRVVGLSNVTGFFG
jgi:hypothetical protein